MGGTTASTATNVPTARALETKWRGICWSLIISAQTDHTKSNVALIAMDSAAAR
jgi:hypothetical protein